MKIIRLVSNLFKIQEESISIFTFFAMTSGYFTHCFTLKLKLEFVPSKTLVGATLLRSNLQGGM
jgi:hypothetical protein